MHPWVRHNTLLNSPKLHPVNYRFWQNCQNIPGSNTRVLVTYAEPGTHSLLFWTKLADSRNIQNLPLEYVFQNKVSIKTLSFKPTNNSHGTACFHQNLHKVQTFEATHPIKFQIIKLYSSQITEHSHNIPQGWLTYSKSQYTETFAYTFPDEIKLELFKHQTIKSLW